MKQATEDTAGADKAQTANEPHRTKDVNRVDNLGIDSRQAIENTNKASHGRCRRSRQHRHSQKHNRQAIEDVDGAEKAQTVDKP